MLGLDAIQERLDDVTDPPCCCCALRLRETLSLTR